MARFCFLLVTTFAFHAMAFIAPVPEMVLDVFFRRSRAPIEFLLGIRRFEWKDGNDSIAWNFENFLPAPHGALYPRQLSLDFNGVTIVQSHVLVVRNVSDKAITLFRSQVRHAMQTQRALASEAESGLRIILGYR